MNVPIACNPDSGGAVCRLLPPCGVLPPRVGLTLIEILMTIFVLAIGLLGVAALLPVGTFQMRQGQIAQQSAEVGSRALDTIEASGINHPGRWARLGGTSFDAVDISDPDHPVRSVWRVDSSGVTPTTFPTKTSPSDPTGCLVEFVRCQKPDLWAEQWLATDSSGGVSFLGSGTGPTPAEDDVLMFKRYEPFAIDPLYVATQGAAPDFALNVAPEPDAGVCPDGWDYDAVTDTCVKEVMPRLTLFDGVGASSTMGLAAAEAVFESTDDLLFTPGTDAGGIEDESKLPEPPRPAKVDATGNVSPRQSRGEYSWLATFVPVEAADNYRDGRTYTVSVAVFYKRPLQLSSTVSERTLTLAHGGGSTFTISGTTFEDNNGNGTFEQEAGDESYIKSGQWGLVMYTVTVGTDTEQRARWYRLGSVGKPDATSGDVKARLIGPDFPTGAGSQQITFYEGLVAVFERTMQVPELPIGEAPP